VGPQPLPRQDVIRRYVRRKVESSCGIIGCHQLTDKLSWIARLNKMCPYFLASRIGRRKLTLLKDMAASTVAPIEVQRIARLKRLHHLRQIPLGRLQQDVLYRHILPDPYTLPTSRVLTMCRQPKHRYRKVRRLCWFIGDCLAQV